MRLASIFLLSLSALFSHGWETNFEKAKQLAAKDHKNILLNFSGSDWCGPCIRLKEEIFESDVFKGFAETNLILLNADFPRGKKNQLSKEQQQLNDRLADSYNPNGVFPFTILLNSDGNVLKSWEGRPNLTPAEWVSQVKNLSNAAK